MEFPITLEYLLINMRELRREKGLTQKDLGSLLGETNTTISNWEKGITTPAITDLMKLSMLYGITIDALVAKERRPEAHRTPSAASDFVTLTDLEALLNDRIEQALAERLARLEKGASPAQKKNKAS